MARRKQTLAVRLRKRAKRYGKTIAKRANKIGRRIDRFNNSNSLARAARRNAKKFRRVAKRTATRAKRYGIKAARAANRFDKRLDKRQRRLLKKAKRSTKRLKKRGLRLFKQLKRRTKTGLRISRKTFKRLSKAYQLRGKKLRQRRSERRKEIKGAFDTSRSRIVQASGDPGASRPGEPPKMRTGEGRYSIKAEVRQRGKQIVSRTYVDKKVAPYMAMWEFRQDGKQRPFLKPGLMNNLGAFQTKVGAELKRASTSAAKRKAVNK